MSAIPPSVGQNSGVLFACHECDWLHRMPPLPEGAVARCRRCGAVLASSRPDHLVRTLTLTFATLVLFTIVNAFPLLELKLGGRETSLTLLSGALELGHHGMWDVVILVLLTSLLFPILHCAALLYVLMPMVMGYKPPGAVWMFRAANLFSPWGMIGVYMLGVLVAFVKLSDMATVVPGVAVYALAALLFCSTAAGNALDSCDIWRRIGEVDDGHP